MLAEERFAQILALMAEKRTATVQELCEALNASESTIRRDLNELDRLGKVNKVHGGATLPDSQFRADEPTMAAKESLAVAEKRAIANAAAALITAEDFVYLDAGSTTLALARAISGPALDAAYVTNGVAHARLLAQKGCRAVPARRAAPPPDRGHHRGGSAAEPAAVQLHQSLYGSQWRGAGRRLHHAGPRGSGCQGCGHPAGAGSLVPRG